jgi:hypothetical protein
MLGASLSALDESAWLLDLSGLPGAFADAWDVRDWPRPPGAVLEADPNGDGILGASLGWRQVLPGDPARSYLYQRLLGDELGTQMPPIPTPAWPPEATRAAFCWVRGLEAPGATAPDAPIDFAGCPGAPELAVQGCHERHDPAPRARCIPGPRGHRLGRRDPRPGRGRRHRPHRHRRGALAGGHRGDRGGHPQARRHGRHPRPRLHEQGRPALRLRRRELDGAPRREIHRRRARRPRAPRRAPQDPGETPGPRRHHRPGDRCPPRRRSPPALRPGPPPHRHLRAAPRGPAAPRRGPRAAPRGRQGRPPQGRRQLRRNTAATLLTPWCADPWPS